LQCHDEQRLASNRGLPRPCSESAAANVISRSVNPNHGCGNAPPYAALVKGSKLPGVFSGPGTGLQPDRHLQAFQIFQEALRVEGVVTDAFDNCST
jgi:hypothetical protein